MDREAWRAIVHRVAKESDLTEATEHTPIGSGKGDYWLLLLLSASPRLQNQGLQVLQAAWDYHTRLRPILTALFCLVLPLFPQVLAPSIPSPPFALIQLT